MILDYSLRAFVAVITLCLLSACGQQNQADTIEVSDQAESISELPEPVNEEFTQQLQATLDQQLLDLSQQESDSAELGQSASLEDLVEQDREALIDQTAEEGSEQVKQDADKLIQRLEDIAAQNQ